MVSIYEHYYMTDEDWYKFKNGEVNMKEAFDAKYDYLHKWFLNENEDLTFEEILVVKKVFDFLKNKMGG